MTAADVTTNYQSAINRTLSGIYQDHSPIVLTHELSEWRVSIVTIPSKFRRTWCHMDLLVTAVSLFPFSLFLPFFAP